jgi:hypothetical protein
MMLNLPFCLPIKKHCSQSGSLQPSRSGKLLLSAEGRSDPRAFGMLLQLSLIDRAPVLEKQVNDDYLKYLRLKVRSLCGRNRIAAKRG